MIVPAAIVDRNKSHARINQPAGHQETCSYGCRLSSVVEDVALSVQFPGGITLTVKRKCLLGCFRVKQCIRLFVELFHRAQLRFIDLSVLQAGFENGSRFRPAFKLSC